MACLVTLIGPASSSLPSAPTQVGVVTLTEHTNTTYNIRKLFLEHGKVAEVDRITEGYLTQFTAEFRLSDADDDTKFEHFAAWLTARKHYSDSTFDPGNLVTGSGGDTGIDAIAVVANNNLITDEAMIEDLIAVNKYLDVTFVLPPRSTRANAISLPVWPPLLPRRLLLCLLVSLPPI
jgi:hypothetical protein